LRSVPAQALGYLVQGDPAFEWNFDAVGQCWQLPANAVLLFHTTAAAYKRWPPENWIALAQGIAAAGSTPVLPWGSESDHARAQQIAGSAPGAVVAPYLSITQWGKLLPQARAVIGLDTGLSHMAAARGVPSVFLFGATPRWRIAPYWGEQHITLGEPGHWPAVSEVLHALHELTN
jgi:heptosyltransferase I